MISIPVLYLNDSAGNGMGASLPIEFGFNSTLQLGQDGDINALLPIEINHKADLFLFDNISGKLGVEVLLGAELLETTVEINALLNPLVSLGANMSTEYTKATIAASMSSLTASLRTGVIGNLAFEPEIAGTGRAGKVATGSDLSLNLVVRGAARGQRVTASGELSLFLRVEGTGFSSLITKGVLSLSDMSMEGHAVSGVRTTGELVLGGFDIEGAGYLIPHAEGSLSLDLNLEGLSFFEQYACLVMNTRNFALTEYDLQLLNVVHFNGKYLGASATKLYELDGTTDDHAQIDWYFKTGKIDLEKQNVNRLRYCWLSYRPNGDLILTVDDGNNEYEYTVTAYDVIDNTVRVKIGKGIKSKYVQLKLENEGPERVFLDRLKLFVEPATKLR